MRLLTVWQIARRAGTTTTTIYIRLKKRGIKAVPGTAPARFREDEIGPVVEWVSEAPKTQHCGEGAVELAKQREFARKYNEAHPPYNEEALKGLLFLLTHPRAFKRMNIRPR